MQNMCISIAYDGTRYCGWQKNPIGNTIENFLQSVLERVLQHPIELQAASRTDAGVHALDQVVNFFTEKKIFDLNGFCLSLNGLLPKDIRVLTARKMPSSFHPTLDCKGKEYRYYICYGMHQLPHHRLYSWHFPGSLNLEIMRKAASKLVGTHNFMSFCNVRKNHFYEDYTRDLQHLEIEEIADDRICIKVKGNHFLYKMARTLSGTIAYMGRGKISLDELNFLLEAKDRKAAGMTAPAHGLFLHQVIYNEEQ